jgi:hypothetical protein
VFEPAYKGQVAKPMAGITMSMRFLGWRRLSILIFCDRTTGWNAIARATRV